LKDSWEDEHDSSLDRATSVTTMTRQTDDERAAIRNAVVQREGVLVSVFDILRRIPRRVLMVLKLNDLTRQVKNSLLLNEPSSDYCTNRSLDRSLNTTHADVGLSLCLCPSFFSQSLTGSDIRCDGKILRQSCLARGQETLD
jgi:hypothetical protein